MPTYTTLPLSSGSFSAISSRRRGIMPAMSVPEGVPHAYWYLPPAFSMVGIPMWTQRALESSLRKHSPTARGRMSLGSPFLAIGTPLAYLMIRLISSGQEPFTKSSHSSWSIMAPVFSMPRSRLNLHPVGPPALRRGCSLMSFLQKERSLVGSSLWSIGAGTGLYELGRESSGGGLLLLIHSLSLYCSRLSTSGEMAPVGGALFLLQPCCHSP